MIVNSLSIYDRLLAVGVPELVAKEHANIMDEMTQQELASKRDMRELSASLQHDMAEFKAGIKAEMQEFKSGIKAEMRGFKTEIRNEMEQFTAQVRHELHDMRRDMGEIELRMKVFMGGMAVTIIGSLTALKYFG